MQKPAKPGLSGVALVVPKATTTLVLDCARTAGVSRKLASTDPPSGVSRVAHISSQQELRRLTEYGTRLPYSLKALEPPMALGDFTRDHSIFVIRVNRAYSMIPVRNDNLAVDQISYQKERR